jgi:hypothetical protein
MLASTSTSPAQSLSTPWEQATALSGLLERLGGRCISDSTPRDGRYIYSCSLRGCPGAPADAVVRGSNEPDRRGLFQHTRRAGARLSRALGVAGFSADPVTAGRAGPPGPHVYTSPFLSRTYSFAADRVGYRGPDKDFDHATRSVGSRELRGRGQRLTGSPSRGSNRVLAYLCKISAVRYVVICRAHDHRCRAERGVLRSTRRCRVR